VLQCGEQAGHLLMQLSLAYESGDTQAAAAAAKQLPKLLDKLSNESSSQFGESEVLSFPVSPELWHLHVS